MSLDRSISSLMVENDNVRKLFVAKVTDVNDPKGLNRIRVEIPGKIIASPHAPWFAPFRLAPFGAGAQFGVYGTPPVGAEVIVYLQDGDVNFGFYAAGYQSMGNMHPEFKDPNVWGFADPSGTKLIVNFATKVMVFTHASGIVETYSGSGSYTMFSPQDQTLQAQNITLDAVANVVVKGELVDVQGTTVNVACENGSVSSSGQLTITGNPINLN